PLLLVDGNLRDAVQLIFNRVFNRDDLVFFVANLVEGRVERGRLTGTGRPRDEHHAVRLRDVATKLPDIFVGESDHIQIQVAKLFVDLLPVENTNNSILAMYRRHNRDAKVNVASLVAHAEAPVLRDAPLGDVEFRHDLDARNEGLVIGQVDWIDFGVERAVN